MTLLTQALGAAGHACNLCRLQNNAGWVLIPPQSLARYPWPGGGSVRSAVSVAGSRTSHYEVLGVKHTADLATIKAAFRQRAKELHPDVSHGTADDPEAFVRLSTAYEILSDDAQRRAYDSVLNEQRLRQQPVTVSRPGQPTTSSSPNTHTPSSAQRARDVQDQPSQSGRLRAVDAQELSAWRYGLGGWAAQVQERADGMQEESHAGRSPPSVVEYYLRKYRAEFEGEVHAALVHAYLGPRLDLAPGHLPRCFESEERSTPKATDELMQLVSGRSLLGSVRLVPPPPEAWFLSEGHAGGGLSAVSGQQGVPSILPSSTLPPAQAIVGSSSNSSTSCIQHQQLAVPSSSPYASVSHSPAGTLTSRGIAASQALVDEADALERAETDSESISAIRNTPLYRRIRSLFASEGFYADPDALEAESLRISLETAGRAAAQDPLLNEGAADAVLGGARQRAALKQRLHKRVNQGSVQQQAMTQQSATKAIDLDGISTAMLLRLPLLGADCQPLEEVGQGQDAIVSSSRQAQEPTQTPQQQVQGPGTAPVSNSGDVQQQQQQQQQQPGVRWLPRLEDFEAEAQALRMQQQQEQQQGQQQQGQGHQQQVDRDCSVLQGAQGLTALCHVRQQEDQEHGQNVSGTESLQHAQPKGPSGLDYAFPPDPLNAPGNWEFDASTPGVVCLALDLGPSFQALAVHEVPPGTYEAPALDSLLIRQQDKQALDVSGDKSQGPGQAAEQQAGAPSSAKVADPNSAQTGSNTDARIAGSSVGRRRSGISMNPSHSSSSTNPVNSSAQNGLRGLLAGLRSCMLAWGHARRRQAMSTMFGSVVPGRVKLYVQGRLVAGMAGRHVYDTLGRRIALVVRGGMPGVQTMHVFDSTTRQLRLLCRCVKARLLPSAVWLFPPRHAHHRHGGWYFEHRGYGRRARPGFMDPALYVLIAACVTHDVERQKQLQARLLRGEA